MSGLDGLVFGQLEWECVFTDAFGILCCVFASVYIFDVCMFTCRHTMCVNDCVSVWMCISKCGRLCLCTMCPFDEGQNTQAESCPRGD